MTQQYFRVVEDSFIGNKLISGEAREVVLIETDLTKGGMSPGKNLQRVNEDGSDLTDEQLAEENSAAIRAAAVVAEAAAEEKRQTEAALRASIRKEIEAELKAEAQRANKTPGATSASATGGLTQGSTLLTGENKGNDFA